MSLSIQRYARRAAALLCLAAFTAQADNNELAKLGEEYLSAGRYAEAIKQFEKITETYENVIAVNFDLAWCYYLTEDYAKAIPKLTDLAGVRSHSESSRQQSMFLLADSHARLAARQTPGSADRKKNIAKAVERNTEFITKYPTNINTPNAIYSRSYAYFLDDKFTEAETDLKTVIQKYSVNPVAKDAQYLLANLYSRQGLDLTKAGKPEEAKVFMEKARVLFSQLAKHEGNLAMANNSLFSLAQTWFNAEMYAGAIRYYREVRPKQDVLKDLDQRLAGLAQQQAAAIGAGGDPAVFKKEIDKLKAQRTSVAESADVMIAAYLQIAVCYYKQQRYDEARIVCRHIVNAGEPAAKAEKEQAYFLIVGSAIEEKNPDAAAAELDGFQTMFGINRPLAEKTSLSIGQLFMVQGNVARAAEQFAKSTDEYPNGKGVEEALYLRFSAEYLLGQAEAASQSAELYLEKFPKGRYVANALYLKAMSLAALKVWDEALATLDEVLEKHPKKTDAFQAQDEVAYQKGYVLWQKAESLDPNQADPALAPQDLKKARDKIAAEKRTAVRDAIREFESFIERYKTSRARPAGLYYLGMALNAAGESDKAKTALYAIYKEYPTNSIAPAALYQVGAFYYAQTNLAAMSQVLEELVQSYPGNAINADAYFFLGYIANKDKRYDDAVEYLYASMEAAPDNPRAPDCLSQAAQAYSDKAGAMGTPTILSDAKRAVYREALMDSARTYEDILLNYPDTDQAQQAIPGMAECISTLIRSQMMTEAQAAAFFKKAMARRPEDTNLKARLLFSQGRTLLKSNQKEQALKTFNDALTVNPEVVLSPDMLADYAEALKEANDLAKAEGIYNKIIKDNPDNPRALAPAWFGLAETKFLQNDFKAARGYYEKVNQEFGWYEPGKKSKVKLSMIYEKQAQAEKDEEQRLALYTKAEQEFTEVWKQEKDEAKLGAWVGVARCQLARAEILKKRGRMQEYRNLLQATDENLTKLIFLWETFDDYVSEALWLKGRAYELVGDQVKARETYDRLVKQYPKCPWAKPGAERLQQVGGPLPVAPAPK